MSREKIEKSRIINDAFRSKQHLRNQSPVYHNNLGRTIVQNSDGSKTILQKNRRQVVEIARIPVMFKEVKETRPNNILLNKLVGNTIRIDLPHGCFNGSILRLDPANGLDGMFFGNPQYSPQMKASVRVGNSVYVQANFGLVNPDGPSYGWDAPGYGFLEVSANGTLISNQNIFKPFNNTSSTLQSLSYTFTVQANTNYYIKAYSLATYEYSMCYSSVSSYDACISGYIGLDGCPCCVGGSLGTC